MAKVFTHPISGCVYTLNEVGLVRIDDPSTGEYGVFDDKGIWYDGPLRDVDFQILGWVGRTPEARALREANA